VAPFGLGALGDRRRGGTVKTMTTGRVR